MAVPLSFDKSYKSVGVKFVKFVTKRLKGGFVGGCMGIEFLFLLFISAQLCNLRRVDNRPVPYYNSDYQETISILLTDNTNDVDQASPLQ